MRRLLVAIFLLLNAESNAQGFLQAKGGAIVDGNNKEVVLRGMGLGGWMLQEPYMLKLSGAAIAQHDIRKKIVDLIGEEKTVTFYNAWWANHCTKADIDSMASWGFNSVRLPMHYNLYTLPLEKEPIKGQNTWLEKGFVMTDSLLSWCKANKIYLILDLHAAPGGQGNDNAISDRDPSLPSLWESEENKAKTIALWVRLAARYKDEPWIGGYDLINEPNWGFKEGEHKNGCDEKENMPLFQLQKDITTAIRAIDKKHMIFAEGNCWGNNYNNMLPLWDDNLVISFHKYWNYNNDSSIIKFIDYRKKYNVPIWLGETGENSNAWFTDVVQLLEKNKIGWAMWPLKKSGINNPVQVKVGEGMLGLIEYWKGNGSKPNADQAFKSLMEFAANTNMKNNIIHTGVIDALFRSVNDATPVPYKKHKVIAGAKIFAADYDMGRSGITYHDKDSAEYWVSTNTRTGWNSGGAYRNDGVDIGVCKDAVTNGYYVGWINNGEWMQYSLYVPDAGSYQINVRYAAADTSGLLQILLGNKVTGNATLVKTGGDQQWANVTTQAIRFKKGWNVIRLLAEKGGFNLNYIEFVKGTSSIRAGQNKTVLNNDVK